MAEIKVTNSNFENEVLKSDKPVLLDFWASWCGPCRMLSPIISEIAQEHPEIKVGKINVDEESELAGAFHVTGIPMLVLMRNGKIENTAVGARPKAQVEAMLRS